MIKVGFIGTGLIARSHARRLSEVKEAAIVGCFDLDQSRSTAFAADFGGSALGSSEDVVALCDAVYICTWTSAHPELVAMAAASNKAVFCEKPLATDLPTVQEMTDAVHAAGIVNQVGLVLRHSPAFRWLAAQAHHPDHGSVMSLIFRDDQYIPIQGMYGSTWRSDPKLAGAGTLIEHSVHDLDLILWLLGPVEKVSCHTAHHHKIAGIEDQATVTLKARSGAQAVLVSVWHDILSRPSQRRVELFRSGGVFGLEGDWSGPVTAELAAEAQNEPNPLSISGTALASEAHRLDGLGTNPDADFIASVANSRAAYPDFSVALEAHKVVDAAYRSAALDGESVSL